MLDERRERLLQKQWEGLRRQDRARPVREREKELSKPTRIDGFIRACNRERRELNASGKPAGKEFEFAAAEATKLLKRRSGGFNNHFLGV
ncbi:hypothetical protein [Ruegeria sp. THAF33]|uniref:hypothetical protein n=1 Tax=Ruegeria sp. THAF33 TaxID=2587853 RepID=UPI0015628869|nr:hypothetical protein [Ruegeria sp. THAF33]